MNVYDNITKLIGKTPLVKLNAPGHTLEAEIFMKLEFMNPTNSIKDRIALSMIETAEREQKLTTDSIIIEPTSGNTGIGLAMACAVKKYTCIIVMPDNMSPERRKIIKGFGAELVLTPATQGMNGAIQRAEELAKQYPNSFIPGQFKNSANPEIHRRTTAMEIWNDTDGKADILVAGVGTGGTLTGIGEVLKQKNPAFTVIAVEPADSPILSGGEPGTHTIQGIGAGFIPEVLHTSIIDEIMQVTTEETFETARQIIRTEGILCGISSGAAIAASIKVGKRKANQGKKIVTILPSGGERYLSTPLYSDIL